MAPEYSTHQKKIIDRYYDQKDNIMLTKLQDMVGELYLVDSEKKREQLWKRIRTALENLKLGPDLIAHIISERDPKLLARHLQDLLKKS